MSVTDILEERAKHVPIVLVNVALIDPSPFQPRRRFSQDELASLADSIDCNGLLNAIILRKVGERYELIAGERRLRSVRDILRAHTIQARIIECSDDEAADKCGIDNFQRANLLPSEKARQVYIYRERGRTVEMIARMLGVSTSSVYELLDVAALPEPVQKMLDDRELKMTHASIIAGIDGAQAQIRAAEMASTGKLTANELKGRTQHLPQRPTTAAVNRQSSAAPKTCFSSAAFRRKCVALRVDAQALTAASIIPEERTAVLLQVTQLIDALTAVQHSLHAPA